MAYINGGKKTKIEIFLKFSFFYQALSYCQDSPQSLSIIHCTVAVLFFSALLLLLGPAKLLLLTLLFYSLFFFPKHQSLSLPITLLFNNNDLTCKKKHNLGKIFSVNASSISSHNSSPLHFYPCQKCANIWVGLIESPSQSAEGKTKIGKDIDGKSCHISKVAA